ncbi:MAG: phosphoribosylamine--glycine ligase [Polyangia bacterium]
MRVLIVGGGGREHALAWALARSAARPTLFVAPGNAGTARVATNLAIAADRSGELREVVRRERIDLVVVGPEAPLVAGLADQLRADGALVFGCSRAAAAIEGSKALCKDLAHRHGIPTAAFGTFSSLVEASQFIDTRLRAHSRIVVKADGLAAGKGVYVCDGGIEAKRAAEDLLAYGGRIVVEEFLVGREASLLAFVVDEDVVPLDSAEDHKTIFDGDRGPMTGGMGVVSPTPVLHDAMLARAVDEILRPSARALVAEGRAFRGLLFAGLMITADGPKLLEYNCRFGDPETEALVARLDDGPGGDLLVALESVAHGRAPVPLVFGKGAAVTVVMAQAGYPGTLAPSVELRGLDSVDALVFHAGTRLDGDRTFSSGGRVLAVTGVGVDVASARTQAYDAVAKIDFPGAQIRRDIGARA